MKYIHQMEIDVFKYLNACGILIMMVLLKNSLIFMGFGMRRKGLETLTS